MPQSRRLALLGIAHPSFTCITPTSYLMKDPDYPIHTTIHVGQIAKYIQFDEQLRTYHSTSNFTSIPVRFSEFGTIWNEGTVPGDKWWISTIILSDNPHSNSVSLSTHPVHLHEFHITPAQAGLATHDDEQPSSTLQAEINQEFTAIMVAQQKKQRQAYEERWAKRTWGFSAKHMVLPPNAHHKSFHRWQKKPQHKYNCTPPSSPYQSSTSLVNELPPVAEDSEVENHEDPIAPEDTTLSSESMEIAVWMGQLCWQFTWPRGQV